MKTLRYVLLAGLISSGNPGLAEYSEGVVKIGVLTDMSSVYADISGPGSVLAAKLAVEDFGRSNKAIKVEIIGADMQNKPDVGAAIANTWFDVDKVNAIVDVPNSGVAFAIGDIIRQKNKVFLISGASSSDLTGSKCSPNSVQWTYDTWEESNSTAKALAQAGGDSWFFITADYVFGYSLERDAAAVAEASGAKVLGKVRHPLNSNDFSSYLLQAQSSKAKVIGLANAGGDTINAIKQAAEFGIGLGGQKVAALQLFVSDVAALGLQTAQGTVLTETWYWDLNESTRSWTRRWQAERPSKFPTSVQAGVYSAVLHYLKAVEALRSEADGRAVVAKMKEMPTDDPLFGKGSVRQDGRKIHQAYLFEVKRPEESRYIGDFYKLRGTIPAEAAFRPLKEGGCSFERR
jgi:branched-chain amino acid transport system substrate-binding protein